MGLRWGRTDLPAGDGLRSLARFRQYVNPDLTHVNLARKAKPSELESFGIRASTERLGEIGVKLRIKVEGENVAVALLPNPEFTTNEQWIHGISVKENPPLAR